MVLLFVGGLAALVIAIQHFFPVFGDKLERFLTGERETKGIYFNDPRL